MADNGAQDPLKERFQRLELERDAPGLAPGESLWQSFERFAAMERNDRWSPHHYVLVGHEAIPAREFFPFGNVTLLWGAWLERADRRVAQDTVGQNIRVSTVFLGTDRNWARFGADCRQEAILFETMIFGGKLNDWQERYHDWDEAVAGHARALKLARATGYDPHRRKRRPPRKRRR